MDAFAVAIACSVTLQRVSHRQTFRLAFHFGLFQAMMPVIGWFCGRVAAPYISTWDHWVAFALLALVGGKAVYESLYGEKNGDNTGSDPTRGMLLVMYSFATSIDALAVGLSLAMLGVPIAMPALVIGVITAILTTIGVRLGSRFRVHLGQRIELVGGATLIAIGCKILLDHLTAA